MATHYYTWNSCKGLETMARSHFTDLEAAKNHTTPEGGPNRIISSDWQEWICGAHDGAKRGDGGLGMATRYSGNAVVHVKWSDSKQGYETSVSVAGRQVWHALLGGPIADSPEAYDDAACSALAFLDAEAEEERFDPFLVRPAYDQHGRVEVSRAKTVDTIAQPQQTERFANKEEA